MNFNELVKTHEPLIFAIIGRLRPFFRNLLTRDDMHQAGMIGLWRASETFDPSRGFEFSTHAWHWITGNIKREAQIALKAKARTDRLSFKTAQMIEDKPGEDATVAADTVRQLIKRLTPAERRTVKLLLDGWTLTEIAELDGVSYAASHQRKARAESRMREAAARLR